MRYLLDKNVIRYAISGLYYGHRRLLSSLETSALAFWRANEQDGAELYISHFSFHVLQPMADMREVQVFLDSVAVLFPTRYHQRWARRIRETTGLSREDAAMIALATFGTNQTGNILGVNALISYDQPMINGYHQHLTALRRRLQAMQVQLSEPFQGATLPEILNPSNTTIQ